MNDVRSKVAHLYRRAGFGARPDELDAAVSQGYAATVDWLLAGLNGPDPKGDAVPLPSLPLLVAPPTPVPTDPATRLALNRQRQQAENRQYLALQQWWLDRMIVTSTPLREKLTLLWSGHFATGFEKVRNAGLMHLQNQLFRTVGGGSFEALTLAVARDPAMQVWLDTVTDVAAHPNENFARELMELFTLGIGNYTETDVKEAARCFTGWSFDRATGSFLLRSRLHDAGQKTVLGQTGAFTGDDLVSIVTHTAASYAFVTAKLWSHLAYPVTPSDPIVVQLAAGYQKDLDITKLLRAIFLHPEFVGATAMNGLVKQPIEYVVGVARAFGLHAAPPAAAAPTTGATPTTATPSTATPGSPPRRLPPSLPKVLTILAQEPFNPPNVGGWPQNEYWLTTASAAARLQFGVQVGASADLSALTALPAAGRPDALARMLSIDGWGSTTKAALGHLAADPPGLVALALSAPEYVLN